MISTSVPPADRPTSPLRVIMVPFDSENPYQRMLKRELERVGVAVCSGKSIRGIPLASVGLFGRNVDVVHLHWLSVMLGPGRVISLIKSALFLGHLLILRFAGKQIVWTAHNIRPHDVPYPKLDRLLRLLVLRLVDSIIVHCDIARSEVARAFHVDKEKIRVIPHGHYIGYYQNRISRAGARSELALDPDALVMLFLGSVRPYKGVTRLIEVFRKLAYPDMVLLIAGRPLTELDKRAVEEAIGSDPAIRFYPGFVPDDGVQKFMNAADVVVFPYQDILTSGAVVLAMSFGRACIAPSIGCVGEILDGPGAFLYSAANEQGLEDAIQHAMEQRGSLAAMGAFNRERASEWSWDRIAAATLTVYAGISRDSAPSHSGSFR